VLAALYRAGIPINKLRSSYVDSAAPNVHLELATQLREVAPALVGLARALAAWEPEQDLAGEAPDAVVAAMFEVVAEPDGRYRWRLVTVDGDILASSSGAYDTRFAVEAAIEQLRRLAPDAPVRDFQD
jgi:uncharacterized protein YegP (UPF0339 family)